MNTGHMKAFERKQPSRITIIAVAIGLVMIGLIGAIQYAGKNNVKPVIAAKCSARLCMQLTVIQFAASQEPNQVLQGKMSVENVRPLPGKSMS